MDTIRRTTHRTWSHGRPGRAAWAGARGFSVIEATVVIGIIAVLAAVVALAAVHVRKKGDVVAEVAMVSALQKAVEQFKQEYGFLPPLVVDTGAGAPIDASDNPVIWNAQDLGDPNSTLNGGSPTDRRCYSVLSLPYYIIGALDTKYDGGAGLTFTAPKRNGTFTKHGRTHEAMVDVTQQKTRLGASRLYISNVTSNQPNQKLDCRIWDRWSDGTTAGNSHAIRYYRWLPQYYPQTDPKAGQVQYWNIPEAIGGNAMNDQPPVNAELRSAEYAIVSPGPDGLFGDEAILTTPAARAKAREDNIMEVGR